MIEEKIYKDSIGQEVKIGDKVAWKQDGYDFIIRGEVESFTEEGHINVKTGGSPKRKFIKIFEQ